MDEIEFPTRQHLADALHGVSAESLVWDGYTADHMPEGDAQLRDAWQALQDAVADVDAATERVKALLPESLKARTWADALASCCPDGDATE